MNYYTVPKIGTGTNDDPIRPDVPSGVSFVCAETNSNSFLIGTNDVISNQNLITDLQGACNYYGLVYTDVLKWSVG